MADQRVGILVFPDVQQLDLTGPFEVFASTPGLSVELVGKSTQPLRSASGLILAPDQTLASALPYDVICVPGGVGVNALLDDQSILTFLRAQAETARFVTSVCTGSLVLGAAGLLTGRQATTHWASHDLLAAFGARPTAARVVRDGKFFTGGGVTAGIDMALTVVAEIFDQATAEAVQLALEYAPAPPFGAGHPTSAPPAVLARVRERGKAVRLAREAIISRLGAPR
ncbi:cyclohexyl-isocyanide hydratase [Arboricoccus pini]|uniref:Cyclohexyl-isocyanide hydratase n=1 Tax=Arboricoccus pini TaxID=1963835 RepID=A0A212RUS9_9PROT|nr:DJ-1/PfpI family protein [Arboricoccus pini]SNB76433.1 cyclohexyl-isocyanide hydratase [Arboricoccus pini]